MTDKRTTRNVPFAGRCPLYAWALIVCLIASFCRADAPSVSYIFPAGGQRGKTIDFKVGGHFLHGGAPIEMRGPGVKVDPRVREVKTLWFEGPLIPMPASQRKEDYPRDHAGKVKIAADAPLGARLWQVWTSEGAAAPLKFVVGDLPEIIEREIDGDPIPMPVKLPVTINGRIFPREDVDVWTFEAMAGEDVTCEVNAARLGSPLDARLEVIDPAGKRIAEAHDGLGVDPRLRFRPKQTGRYQVRIHDISFAGLQHYVYRLTITAGPHVDFFYPLGGRRGRKVRLQMTGQKLPKGPVEVSLPAAADETYRVQLDVPGGKTNAVLLDVDELEEHLEAEPNNTAKQANPASGMAVLNGRIDAPGDVDYWAISLEAGDVFDLDVRAARLGSPLDSVLTLFGPDGKQIAENDNLDKKQSDSRLRIIASVDGVYRVRVAERFRSRGGPAFAYRLRIAPPRTTPGFRLKLPVDTLSVHRGVWGLKLPADQQPKPTPGKLKIVAERFGGFTGPITLELKGLPADVAAEGTTIAKKKFDTEITLTPSAKSKIGAARFTIVGTAEIDGKKVTSRATLPAARGEAARDSVLLAVALQAPFKFSGEYILRYAPQGSIYRRSYKIDRGGFLGPLSINMADRQVRHLQGLNGDVMEVAADAREFRYPVHLATWMEIGRTARAALVATGEVTDHDGSKHTVSYSSDAQNDQIILQPSPGWLAVESARRSLSAQPNSQVQLKVRIRRHQKIAGRPVKIELILPAHVEGVEAAAVIIPAEKQQATLSIRLAQKIGPFNAPATLRATTLGTEDPHVAESPVELVP
jgi:hypothetical protein